MAAKLSEPSECRFRYRWVSRIMFWLSSLIAQVAPGIQVSIHKDCD